MFHVKQLMCFFRLFPVKQFVCSNRLLPVKQLMCFFDCFPLAAGGGRRGGELLIFCGDFGEVLWDLPAAFVDVAFIVGDGDVDGAVCVAFSV